MKRNTLILVGILALLIVATFFVLERPGERSVTAEEGAMLVTYDSASVDRIVVSSRSDATTLQREGAGWMLTSPLRAKADDAAVHQLIGNARRIALKAMVSSNPQKKSVFQVDSTGTLVRLYKGDQEQAAFRIGKPGSTYTETYVRREGSDEVYLADGLLLYTYVKQPRDWRDKAIVRLPQESIRNVRLQYGDTTFTLAFQDSTWRIDGIPAAEYTVRSFIGSLASLNADNFVDSTITAPPPLTAQIDVDGVQLRFHKNPLADTYFVVSSGKPQVYEMQGWHAAQVLKRKNEFTAPAQ